MRLDISIPSWVYEAYSAQTPDSSVEQVRALIEQRLSLCHTHSNPRDLHIPADTRRQLQAHLGNDLSAENILVRIAQLMTLRLVPEDGNDDDVVEVTISRRALDRFHVRAKALHKPYVDLVSEAARNGIGSAVGVFR